MNDHTRDECPHCHARSRGGAYCWDCEDSTAAFRGPFCAHEADGFHGVRIPVQIIREDLKGRLSEYRGIQLTDDAPRSITEWEAIRNADLPDEDDLSLAAQDARRRARSPYLRHVITIDCRLPFEVASCRAWHELMHAAHREIDPENPRPCREAELDALIARIDRRDWPTRPEREPLHEEALARASEELTWTYGWPLLENKRPTLPQADVETPRIIAAHQGDITHHSDYAAYWVEHMRRIGRAWELTGSTAFPFDRRYTVDTLDEHHAKIDHEAELRQAAVQLGLDLDLEYELADEQIGQEPEPHDVQVEEPESTEIRFGGLAVIRFPGIEQELIDAKPALRDLFEATLANHQNQNKESE